MGNVKKNLYMRVWAAAASAQGAGRGAALQKDLTVPTRWGMPPESIEKRELKLGL